MRTYTSKFPIYNGSSGKAKIDDLQLLPLEMTNTALCCTALLETRFNFQKDFELYILKKMITNTEGTPYNLKATLKLHEISRAKNDPSVQIRKEPYPISETR